MGIIENYDPSDFFSVVHFLARGHAIISQLFMPRVFI